MEDLSNATGIGSDANFLNGNLVDAQTLINAFINQDPIQFFQKLANLAGIVFNDLPDNETNDYQTIEALETVVRTFAATTLLKGTVEKAIQAESDAGTADKFPDAAAMLSTILSNIQGHGAWQTPSYVDTHSDYTAGDFSGLRYRILANGMLQLAGSFQRSVVTAGIVFTTIAGYRPAQTLPIFGRREDNTLVGGSISSAGVVTIFLDSSVGGDHMDLNIIVPLDLTV